ncbi:MAG: hypothetical protein CSB16_00475 [Clostridiales bacterium]|nr:MAG: hypothetical protein CSB16_00475 [Clostridiales bacterium]
MDFKGEKMKITKKVKQKYKNYTKFFFDIWKASKLESKKANMNRIRIYLDILWQRMAYSFIVLDYQTLGFAYVRDRKKRKEYLMPKQWQEIDKSLNDFTISGYNYYSKLDSVRCLKSLFRRDILIIDDSTAEDIEAFMTKNKECFAKVDVGYGGLGVEKLNYSDFSGIDEFMRYIKEKKYAILEEVIKQHPDVSKLSPTSINTIRMTTLTDPDGKIHFLQHIIRMSDGTSNVDNITSGGIYAFVNRDGMITSDVATGDNMSYDSRGDIIYEKHPLTKIPFKGYKIPFIKEAEDLVEKGCKINPHYKYLGWDMAITPDGPDIVEVNNSPGYDMIQNYHHVKGDMKGNAHTFEEILGIKFNRKNIIFNRGSSMSLKRPEYEKTYQNNKKNGFV